MDWDDAKQKIADPWWRLSNLYAITDKQGKLVKFKPNLVQKKFYDDLWWLNYVLKSRQHGLSTFCAILFLDRLLFEEKKKAGMIDYKLDDGRKKLAMMKLAYNNLDNKDIHPDTWGVGELVKQRVRLIKGQDSPFPEEIVFSNESTVYTSTSMRGGTVQYLHVSEYGKISLNSPNKAVEIVEGAENALHEGSICIYETTHEGGRTGLAYDTCKLAMSNSRDQSKLTRLDSMFHFFGWYLDPANKLSDSETRRVIPSLDDDQISYYEELKQRDFVPELTNNQIAWHAKKKVSQKEGMLKEHPSTPEEAFQAMIHGAIYGAEMGRVRAENRICNYPIAKEPVLTFWDLGYNDATSIWFIQLVGQEIRVIDWYENRLKAISHYGEYVKRWAQDNNHVIDNNFLPHDGKAHQLATGGTLEDSLAEMGIRVESINRTPDKWVSIDKVRELIPRMWFRKDQCERKWNDGERDRPSGIDCLEGYRMKPEVPGKVSSREPIHDEFSHSCDALRTFAEAMIQGRIGNALYSEQLVREQSPVIINGGRRRY